MTCKGSLVRVQQEAPFFEKGKDFDRFLEEAGGTRILPRVELDACFDQSIEPFIEQVQTWLQKYGDSFKK